MRAVCNFCEKPVIARDDWVLMNAGTGEWPFYGCHHCAYEMQKHPLAFGKSPNLRLHPDQLVPGLVSVVPGDSSRLIEFPIRVDFEKRVSANQCEAEERLRKMQKLEAEAKILADQQARHLGTSAMTEVVKRGFQNPIHLKSLELLQEFGAAVPVELIDRLPSMNDGYARGLVLETSTADVYKIAINIKQHFVKEVNAREVINMPQAEYDAYLAREKEKIERESRYGFELFRDFVTIMRAGNVRALVESNTGFVRGTGVVEIPDFSHIPTLDAESVVTKMIQEAETEKREQAERAKDSGGSAQRGSSSSSLKKDEPLFSAQFNFQQTTTTEKRTGSPISLHDPMDIEEDKGSASEKILSRGGSEGDSASSKGDEKKLTEAATSAMTTEVRTGPQEAGKAGGKGRRKSGGKGPLSSLLQSLDPVPEDEPENATRFNVEGCLMGWFKAEKYAEKYNMTQQVLDKPTKFNPEYVRKDTDELCVAVRIINNREVLCLDATRIEAEYYDETYGAWAKFRKECFPASQTGKKPKVSVCGCVCGNDREGYIIPGTVQLGMTEKLCGNALNRVEGEDFNPDLHSLGRIPCETYMEQGYQQLLTEHKCIRGQTGQCGQMHKSPCGMLLTRGMYEGVRGDAGLKSKRLYLHNGRRDAANDLNQITNTLNSMITIFGCIDNVSKKGSEAERDPEDPTGSGVTQLWCYCHCGQAMHDFHVWSGVLDSVAPAYPQGCLEFPKFLTGLEDAVMLDRVDLVELLKNKDSMVYPFQLGSLGHLECDEHRRKAQIILAMNAIFGKPRNYRDYRHMVQSDCPRLSSIFFKGIEYYFWSGSLITVPCIEGVRDNVGANFEAGSFVLMKIIEAGKLLIKLTDGKFYLVKLADVASISPCIMRWSTTFDGFSSTSGQYGNAGGWIWDTCCLPETYEEYFRAAGTRFEMEKDRTDRPPVKPEEMLNLRLRGSGATPFNMWDLREMERNIVDGLDLVEYRYDFDRTEKTPAEYLFESMYPLSDLERKWWLGYQIRWSPNASWVHDPSSSDFFKSTTAVVCQVQMVEAEYLTRENLKSTGAREGGWFHMGWLVQGSRYQLGSGIMKRVMDSRIELNERLRKNESLSVEEQEFLQMDESEIEARSAIYLNEILHNRKKMDFNAAGFAMSLAQVDTSGLVDDVSILTREVTARVANKGMGRGAPQQNQYRTGTHRAGATVQDSRVRLPNSNRFAPLATDSAASDSDK